MEENFNIVKSIYNIMDPFLFIVDIKKSTSHPLLLRELTYFGSMSKYPRMFFH